MGVRLGLSCLNRDDLLMTAKLFFLCISPCLALLPANFSSPATPQRTDTHYDQERQRAWLQWLRFGRALTAHADNLPTFLFVQPRGHFIIPERRTSTLTRLTPRPSPSSHITDK